MPGLPCIDFTFHICVPANHTVRTPEPPPAHAGHVMIATGSDVEAVAAAVAAVLLLAALLLLVAAPVLV